MLYTYQRNNGLLLCHVTSCPIRHALSVLALYCHDSSEPFHLCHNLHCNIPYYYTIKCPVVSCTVLTCLARSCLHCHTPFYIDLSCHTLRCPPMPYQVVTFFNQNQTKLQTAMSCYSEAHQTRSATPRPAQPFILKRRSLIC